MKEPPHQLLQDPNFVRYWKTWCSNQQSIAFAPLADFYRKEGFLEEAEEICRKGLEFHPESVTGRMVLALICRECGKSEEAIGLAGGILETMPTHEEARELLQKAAGTKVRRDGEKVEKPWQTVTMAEVYAAQGELKTALEICKTILEREPGDERARQMKSRVENRLLEKWGRNEG
ncbi:MAG: tetratricopeptide repeat protein [Deltaproteobacteria bacterium]|nr:tetratricopeptide repeat protein [Deltaproteobacteria bacterium]